MQAYSFLLIHGFGGGLWELAPLEKDLVQLGHLCHSVKLPGHDEQGRITSTVDVEDFGATVLKAYDLLKKDRLPLVVIGFSMGALLAAWLATVRNPEKIILINTPIHIGQPNAVLHWLQQDWKHKDTKYTRILISNAFRQRPDRNLLFLAVRKRYLPALQHVDVPVFLAQSFWDETVQLRSIKKAMEYLPNPPEMVKHYANSRHHLCDGPDFPLFLQDLLQFIEQPHSIRTP